MRKHTGSQEDLFDSAGSASAEALVALPASAGPLNPAQRAFNRLTGRVRRGRERLAAWEAFIARVPGRVVAELQPVEKEIRSAQRRLLRQLDVLLAGAPGATGERLSRKHRAAARSLLLEIAGDMLQDGPDAELEALHDRYSDISLAEESHHDLEMAELLFGEMFGADITQGHNASNVEELLEHAADRLAAQAEAEAEGAKRGGGRRTTRKAQGQAQSELEATSSVRQIYRKLASALHPDREADPTEHQRKTRLLQRANQAYAHNDLLDLLALQIEVEQIDPGMLASLPEARLRSYNQVLLEQARALEAQVEECASIFAMDFGMHNTPRAPEDADRALSAHIVTAIARAREIEQLADRLADPQQRREVLEELRRERAQYEIDEIAVFDELFGGGPRTGPKARGKGKRKRERRKR